MTTHDILSLAVCHSESFVYLFGFLLTESKPAKVLNLYQNIKKEKFRHNKHTGFLLAISPWFFVRAVSRRITSGKIFRYTMSTAEVFSKSNPVFASFAFYCAVLMLKMTLVIAVTIYQRVTRNSYSSPEDVRFNDPQGKKNLKVETDDEVERPRRAHLNDMENILPFILAGLLYITTNPSVFTATMLFRVFTFARVTHTIVYLSEIRQPFRGLAFHAGLIVNIIMLFQIIAFYL